MNPRHLLLAAGDLHLELAPALGGAIAAFGYAGFALLRETQPGAEEARDLACYPLVPFSNRIAGGVFTFAGRRHRLRCHPVGGAHAIHGEGWLRPWTVTEASPRYAHLALEYGATEPDSWPFPFRAEQHFVLAENGLTVTLVLANTGAAPAPAGIGLHPYFPRHGGVMVGFRAGAVWTNGTDHLPAERRPPPAEWRFETPRGLGEPGLDNCFAAWSGTASIAWPEARLGLEIAADACFGHLVVFTPAGREYFAFEPVSHMNDAINRMHRVPDHGLVVLAAGQRLTGSIRFTIRARA